MEIAPVAGIRVLPAIKQRPVDPELTADFDVELVARLDEDTYTGSGKKAAGAEEDGEEQPEELEDVADADASVDDRETAASKISLFA